MPMKKKSLLIIILLVLAVGGGVWGYLHYLVQEYERETEFRGLWFRANLYGPGPLKHDQFHELLTHYSDLLTPDQILNTNYGRLAYYTMVESRNAATFNAYAEAFDAAAHGHPKRLSYLRNTLWVLMRREIVVDRSEAWAREVLAALEKDGEDYAIADARGTLAAVLFAVGKPEEAWPFAEEAARFLSDDEDALARAGKIAEALGKREEAADYYLRALAVFGAEDEENLLEEKLKPLYVSLHGSDKGLAENLAERKEASRRFSIFEAPTVETPYPAPAWTLPSLEGTEGTLAALKGTATLVKFWGYWCGPCREEFPHVQKVYAKMKAEGAPVSIVSINWERGKPLEEAKAIVSQFFEEQKITVPTFFDVEGKVVEDYEVNTFPTSLVLDAEGKVRYRNVGYHPMCEEIFEAQLRSLLAPKGKR